MRHLLNSSDRFCATVFCVVILVTTAIGIVLFRHETVMSRQAREIKQIEIQNASSGTATIKAIENEPVVPPLTVTGGENVTLTHTNDHWVFVSNRVDQTLPETFTEAPVVQKTNKPVIVRSVLNNWIDVTRVDTGNSITVPHWVFFDANGAIDFEKSLSKSTNALDGIKNPQEGQMVYLLFKEGNWTFVPGSAPPSPDEIIFLKKWLTNTNH